MKDLKFQTSNIHCEVTTLHEDITVIRYEATDVFNLLVSWAIYAL